jgi:hypothetical protein
MPKTRPAGFEKQAVRWGRACKVCGHADRVRIELACASGKSDRKIAAEYPGVSRDSIRRHWAAHVSPVKKSELLGGPGRLEELAIRAAAEGRSILDYVAVLCSELMALFLHTKQNGSPYDASSVASRLTAAIDLRARLTGELRAAGVTVNVANSVNAGPMVVLNSPEVIKLQSVVIRSLASFPEARAAVVAALRNLGDGHP